MSLSDEEWKEGPKPDKSKKQIVKFLEQNRGTGYTSYEIGVELGTIIKVDSNDKLKGMLFIGAMDFLVDRYLKDILNDLVKEGKVEVIIRQGYDKPGTYYRIK